MKPGDIYAHKVSGQYAVIVDIDGTDVGVRMAKDSKDEGTDYVYREFQAYELETAQEHLKRELAEMEFRQELMEGAQERAEQRKLAKIPSPKVAQDFRVN